MPKKLCERCKENYAALRVYITDIDGHVLEADRVCLECIAFDSHGNIEVDFAIGKAALEAAQRRSQPSGETS